LSPNVCVEYTPIGGACKLADPKENHPEPAYYFILQSEIGNKFIATFSMISHRKRLQFDW